MSAPLRSAWILPSPIAGMLVLIGLIPCMARAQPATEPRLIEMDPCVQVDGPELERIVRIEVRPIPGSEARSTPPIVLTCDDGGVAIAVGAGDGRVQRNLALWDTPEATRERLLAIAIAELVAISHSEPGTARPPERRGRAPADPAPIASDREASLRLTGGIGARATLSVGSTAWMVNVALATDLWGPFRLRFEVASHASSSQASLGEVRALVFTGSAALLLVSPPGSVYFDAGLGVRGGGAGLSGQAFDPETVSGRSAIAPWLSPFATAAMWLEPAGMLAFEFRFEAGYVAPTIDALVASSAEAQYRSWSLAAHAAVGIRL